MSNIPLDAGFTSFALALRQFKQEVSACDNKSRLGIAILRPEGCLYRYEIDVFMEEARNEFIIERLVKALLWMVGGNEIRIAGPMNLVSSLQEAYRIGGAREFDYRFWSKVYGQPFCITRCEYEELPPPKPLSHSLGGYLNLKRIGLDIGGSDMKLTAVNEGQAIASQEIVWDPKNQEDIRYHQKAIYRALKEGIDELGGDVNAIGISTAGVIVDNQPMVSSLFIRVPEEEFDQVKRIYTDIIARLEKELRHRIAFSIANDGDVTALAGAQSLDSGAVLGVSMGTSEAGGYVDTKGNLNQWFSELAFVPIDLQIEGALDPWSLDVGVGSQYLSQDAVIRLAQNANIVIDSSLSPAEKLSFVQNLVEKGNERAEEVFASIGRYAAHAIAFYSEFYHLRHVLLLGRVTSGKGGDILYQSALETLQNEFPDLAHIQLHMPKGTLRRLGQSLAAASLAEIG